ncbi:MAG: OmpA family protein [Burkholderiales bacterium]
MNNLNKIAAAIALLSLAVSPTVLAQTSTTQSKNYNPSWYFAPSISSFDPDDKYGVNGTGAGLGLRFGKPIASKWDIQVGPAYGRQSINGLRAEQLTLGADALYFFSRGEYSPFLLAGLGVERDKVNAPTGSVSRTSPMIEAGLGMQYAFSNKWMGQLDYRRVYGFLRDNTSFPFNRSNDNYVSLGVGYALGAPPATAASTRQPQVQMPILPAPTPAPIPAPPPAPVAIQAPAPAPAPVPMPRVERITMSDTELFDFNSANLRLPQPKLDEMANVLASNPQINNVVVNGYTDRLGTNTYNQRLSQKRAEAVRSYLVGKGVASNRIRAVGHGESNPVVECADQDRTSLIRCLEPNRRVEIEQITVERTVR